jgi:hypothetical protein
METATSSDGSAMQTSDPGATPTPAPGSAKGPAAPLSLEEATKRLAELEHAHGNAKEELDRHRKFRASYDKQQVEAEAAKKAAEDAQLAEIDRVKKQYAEEQSARAALELELQETHLQHIVEREAQDQNFIHPALIVRLLDSSELEFENGKPANVKKLVEKLAKTMPELIRASTPAPATLAPTGTPSPATPQASFGTPALPAMNPGRTSITQPGNRPAGHRPPRLTDQGIFSQPGTIRQDRA